MAISLDAIRKLALSLPGTTEEPHHNFGSFRVRGKIFITVPPGGALVQIFLPDIERDQALAMDSEFLEPVVWGSKVLGVRAFLPKARASTIQKLVKIAYAYKEATAPKKRRALPAEAGTLRERTKSAA